MRGGHFYYDNVFEREAMAAESRTSLRDVSRRPPI